MRIQKPAFTLHKACPRCRQGSSLTFFTCQHCEKIILVCHEEGTVFPNPHDLTQETAWICEVWQSPCTTCPHCQREGEFRFSTGEEIQQYEFRYEEYT